jgi:3D-(3,5/4)-trihydroxycyclohexane-1,2-dione acylhydrolase (decyclizing)
MAQALVRYLVAQKVDIQGQTHPLFAGVFAIFGHGNVAAMGEALANSANELPTYRAHNEQGMAHAAIAYAKAKNRRQIMACTSSIGPGAANMVTTAALAHVNRLPVLFLPGDVFASRTPDPVLQQVECFGDPNISTNDCFSPVSRYFDRITRPEQLITSLTAAINVLTDPELCGPVTLSLCQDVQAEAYDYPTSFFEEQIHYLTQQGPDEQQLIRAANLLTKSQRPLIIAGGGVHYSEATRTLQNFAEKHAIPVAETQAGKGSIHWNHPNYVGAIGVTGSTAANKIAEQADTVLAIGTRLQDFTTGSRTIFSHQTTQLIQLNVGKVDSGKHGALPLRCDAKLGLQALNNTLKTPCGNDDWLTTGRALNAKWNKYYDEVTRAEPIKTETGLPSDAQVLGAVKRASKPNDTVVCAAGGLPGELHKLWRAETPGSYHVEYGYSCMGYEIAGAMGVKMAHPEREVYVVVGDGSYMMLNSELATSVMLGYKIIVVVLDNRGFGCINRLQKATGNRPFNNLLEDCLTIDEGAPKIDFAAHAAAMGAVSEKVNSISNLEAALERAKASKSSYLIAIDTDPYETSDGGHWWDVAIPEVSENTDVQSQHQNYIKSKKRQPY